MTIDNQLRWSCLTMFYVYGIDHYVISKFACCSQRSTKRWVRLFELTGNVAPALTRNIESRWPNEAKEWVKSYALEHPCFYLEELQQELKERFSQYIADKVMHVSISTICRVLRFDLGLSRKVLTKRAREAKQDEINNFVQKLQQFSEMTSWLSWMKLLKTQEML